MRPKERQGSQKRCYFWFVRKQTMLVGFVHISSNRRDFLWLTKKLSSITSFEIVSQLLRYFGSVKLEMRIIDATKKALIGSVQFLGFVICFPLTRLYWNTNHHNLSGRTRASHDLTNDRKPPRWPPCR
jgi:hypothetical protein